MRSLADVMTKQVYKQCGVAKLERQRITLRRALRAEALAAIAVHLGK